jgi:hypothetical protein
MLDFTAQFDHDGFMKIISGGQSGVDRAALDVAIERGMEWGGWCPKGRLGGEPHDATRPPGEGRALGLSVIARGTRADKSGFCYFDTRTKAAWCWKSARRQNDPWRSRRLTPRARMDWGSVASRHAAHASTIVSRLRGHIAGTEHCRRANHTGIGRVRVSLPRCVASSALLSCTQEMFAQHLVDSIVPSRQ